MCDVRVIKLHDGDMKSVHLVNGEMHCPTFQQFPLNKHKIESSSHETRHKTTNRKVFQT